MPVRCLPRQGSVTDTRKTTSANMTCQPVHCHICGNEIACGELCRREWSRSGNRCRWACARPIEGGGYALHGMGHLATYWCTEACRWRAYRASRRLKQRECASCGKSFTTSRTDARFCSGACRVRARRQRARA
jgi:hypothetical protein